MFKLFFKNFHVRAEILIYSTYKVLQIEWNGEQQGYSFYLVINLSPLDFQRSYCTW